MVFTRHDLLFIHDRTKNTLPFLRVLPVSYHSAREIGRLDRLRLKCRKELFERFDYSYAYLDAER